MTGRERRLYLADVAELAGLRVRTLTSYRAKGMMPEPDGVDAEKGHVRPWWLEATVKAWLAGRPGKGWRQGQRMPA